MSRRGDYLYEMLTHRLFSRRRDLDAAFEAALNERVPDSERGEMAISLIQTVRASLDQPPPPPNAEMAVLLEQGLADGEISTTTGDVPLPPQQAVSPSQRARRGVLGPAFARVAALGLFAKLTLGGVAFAAAATGAGAAGVLPAPAQEAFDRVSAMVMGEPRQDEIAPDDSGRNDPGEGNRTETEPGPVDRDVRDRIEDTDPSDRGSGRSFGDDVSDTGSQHRQDDAPRGNTPADSDTVPSGDHRPEQPQPVDPPANQEEGNEDSSSGASDEPDNPATNIPGGLRTPPQP
ncbi:MAG: hypothetical protein WD358_06560 [Nitriliruptoraceae bacterium]